MKVKKLRKLLKRLPQDSIVILQKDAEGNGYSPLAEADGDCVYLQSSTWAGEVYSTNWSHDEADMDRQQWEDCKTSNPPCVVLIPVN